jgi:DNA polymerase-4
MGYLCRDCLNTEPPADGAACPACGSARSVSHAELHVLGIAHLDCDAFYATVEKRDDPSLKDKPVLVGGAGGRGVVTAACYIARRYGCRSAMPMFKARQLCPQAVVIRPDMAKYVRVGREVRALMQETTPLVEPISVDEAFLDLTGTERLHKGSPARTLARLVQRINDEIGIDASIGLSHNKFIAKIASDAGKPRGFFVVGKADTMDYLAGLPVAAIWGAGAALCRKLEKDGFRRIHDLRAASEDFLVDRYGSIGHRLYRFARGEDNRRVDPTSNRKSVSAEITFSTDLASPEDLRARLWPLCEKVAARAKADGIGGAVVTLKLKGADFRIRTRRATLPHPTQLAERLWRAGERLLTLEADGTPFRLIGIGLSELCPAAAADPPDLAEPDGERIKAVEHAMDTLRARFGDTAISRGRRLDTTTRRPTR